MCCVCHFWFTFHPFFSFSIFLGCCFRLLTHSILHSVSGNGDESGRVSTMATCRPIRPIHTHSHTSTQKGRSKIRTRKNSWTSAKMFKNNLNCVLFEISGWSTLLSRAQYNNNIESLLAKHWLVYFSFNV